MAKKKLYFYLHLIHGLFVLTLLLTGAFLYVPFLRISMVEYRYTIREFHSILGIVYFVFILAVIPYMAGYLRRHRFWQKTFHVCLQYSLGIGWAASGIFLWINNTNYLGIRQTSIGVHDVLSLFIVPWTLGHIGLWYLRKKGIKKRTHSRDQVHSTRDRGIIISRRDVLLLFAGAILSLLAGGLFRWYRPISDHFLAGLNEVKKRGYFRNYSLRNDPPVFDPAAWSLKADGLVEKPTAWTWEELMKLPKQTLTDDFHCVTGWSVLGVEWEGIPFREVVKAVGPRQEGIYVKMYSADQLYSETYQLKQLLEQNVILAYQLDGKALIPTQGAPLRLYHPSMYGYKSIKWLQRMEFTDARGLGYWEEKEGYDLDGYLS
jgi:hypothetical protein